MISAAVPQLAGTLITEVMPDKLLSGMDIPGEAEWVILSLHRSAPVAVPFKFIDEPEQMLISLPADTFDGPGLILTNVEVLDVHPLGEVTVT